MRVFALIAHPRRDSFCHALCEKALTALERAGHRVTLHDLYDEDFDPVLKAEESYTVGDTVEQALSKARDPLIRTHRKEIAEAEGLLVVHPNWWGKPPAMLSGWLDRVLVPGVAYRLATAEGEPDPLLSVRTALILNTSDTPEEREKTVLGDPLQLIWGNCVLPYCGVQQVHRRTFGPVAGSTPQQREHWLLDVEELVARSFSAELPPDERSVSGASPR